jgi:uncharacterized protein
MDKLQKLRELFRSFGSCLVAYSGGVDSAFLACLAREELGDRVLAVVADSPSLPRRELAEAIALGKRFGFPVRVIRTKEFDNPDYLTNPNNRCYFCKHNLFAELVLLARAEQLAVIVYGENASDVGDFRPGVEAAREFHVRAPLKEVGLTKPEIRQLSAQFGLPTAAKPEMACLSSRVPYGEAITPEKLQMIEEAEYFLRDLGFHDVRVRHHELRSTGCGVRNEGSRPDPESASIAARGTPVAMVRHLARIEVGPEELAKFLADGVSAQVSDALRKIGYAHVTLDLQGYRRGSVNEVIAPAAS